MEYVKGREIGKSLRSLQTRDVERMLEICRVLDRLGIQKEEMNHPDRHIIISDRVVFIDFERSVYRSRPSNLTQFAVYLNTRLGLMSHGELSVLLKKYKREFTDDAYREVAGKILELIG